MAEACNFRLAKGDLEERLTAFGMIFASMVREQCQSTQRATPMNLGRQRGNSLVAGFILCSLCSVSCSEDVEFANPFDPAVPLGQPTNLAVSSFSETALALTWKSDLKIVNPAQANDARIVVEQSADGSGFFPIDSLPAAASGGTVNKSFEINRPYWFRIHSSVGGRVSPNSAPVKSEIGLLGPSGFLAVQVTETVRRFTWLGHSTAEAYFSVERRLGTGGTYLPIGKTPPGTTTFSDSTVILTDSVYAYRISAVSGKGTVSTYDSVSVSIPFAPPSDVLCAGTDPASLTLQWRINSSIAIGSIVERSAGVSPFTPRATTGPNVSQISDDQVDRKVSYGYRVRNLSAYNMSGYSPVTRADFQCTSMRLVFYAWPDDGGSLSV